MSKDFLLEKKKHGIYYTPPEASKILCEWAIKNTDDKILEPSFGACGFLESSRARLIELGNQSPSLQLFGCDTDPKAFNGYLHSKFSDPTILRRFIEGDFLEKKPEDFPVSEFDVILGNPPYVSHHNMSADQRKSCAEIAPLIDCNIGSRASLWAYFVLHGLKFLKKEGRIAWVLPNSFLHSKYADKVKDYISENFARSIIIQVGQRLFASEGTEEGTAILLAENWKSGNNDRNLKIEFARTLLELKSIVSDWKDNLSENKNYENRSAYSLLSQQANEVLDIIEREKKVMRLGDSLEVLIGIVTGDNRFFIINRSTANAHKVADVNLTPIFSRFSMAQGLSFSKRDLNKLKKQNFRCLLIDTSKTKNLEPSVEEYLKLFPEEKKQSNVTFKKRRIWHQPDDGRIPLAFFSYMHHQGPRLVINNASVTCTNTIHRVFQKKIENGKATVSPTELKLLAISLQTTYSQLSAELEGRVYGSGALKHEPSEAKKIKILLNPKLSERQIERAYKIIDSLFRDSRFDDARRIADKLLLGGLEKKLNRPIISILENAMQEARARRYDSKVIDSGSK